MRKYILIISCAILIYGFRSEQGYFCLHPIDNLFSVRDLRTQLVGGEWQYQYSYFQDTCFEVDNLISLPALLQFRVDKDSVKHNASRNEKNLRNIICTHKDNISGKMFETLPCGIGKYNPDSLLEFISVSQIPSGNAEGMKVRVYYTIQSIKQDTMVAYTGYMMNIRGKQEHDVHHVFYRKLMP